MARYRKVDPRIWNDAKFRSMTDNGKLAFLFLLTHPHMTALGAMRATPAGLAAELEWTAEGFRKAFQEALSKGMAKVDEKACFIWLPKFLKYNRPENPNVLKAWGAAWDLLPECELKIEVFQQFKAFAEQLPEGFRKAFREAWVKPSPNQEQEPEQEPEPKPPPPTPSANTTRPASPLAAEGGGGGEILFPAWEELAGRLRKLGMCDASTAVDTARGNGLTFDQVVAIANVWEARRPAWRPGALHWRLIHGAPDQDATEGWPPAEPGAAPKSQPSERDRANHMGQSLNRKLRHLPPLQRDAAIRAELVKAGFGEAAIEAAGYPEEKAA